MAMTENHRTTLRKARVYLLENLDIDTIIPHLVSELLLSPADEECVTVKSTKRDKIKHLLDLLPRKGDSGYTKLMKILKEEQTFVYDELCRVERDGSPASVPQQPAAEAMQVRVPQSFQQQPVGASFSSHLKSPEELKPLMSAQPTGQPGYPEPSYVAHPTDQVSMDQSDSPMSPSPRQITSAVDTGQPINRHSTLPRSPQSIVNDKALGKLAGNLGPEWEQLAIHMGFKPQKLYHWKQESQHSVWGQVFAMLNCWKQQTGAATISQLLSVLVTCDPPLDPTAYRHLYFE